MSTQWGFFYDQTRCIGCRACELACKNWNDERRGDKDINVDSVSAFQEKYYTAPYALDKNSNYIDPLTGANNYAESRKYYMKEDWRRVSRHPYGSIRKDSAGQFVNNFDIQNLSISCNHCDSPACIAACPTGRIFKEPEFGAVVINTEKQCTSCGECKTACPWSAPQFYDDLSKYEDGDPSKPKMTKCTLCLDRIREGLKPACVAGCMLRALDAGPISELRQTYPNAQFRDLKEFPYGNTGPNIYFLPKKCKAKV